MRCKTRGWQLRQLRLDRGQLKDGNVRFFFIIGLDEARRTRPESGASGSGGLKYPVLTTAMFKWVDCIFQSFSFLYFKWKYIEMFGL